MGMSRVYLWGMSPKKLPPAPPSVEDAGGAPRYGTYQGALDVVDLSRLRGSYQPNRLDRLRMHKKWLYGFIATREVAALFAVVEHLSPDDWQAASPCEGWTAADVLSHLIDTQRSFLVDRGFDLGSALDVSSAPARAWKQHAAKVLTLLADPEVIGFEYDGWFGPTTVGATIERFYLFDMVVHRWDIATAAGVETEFSDVEMDAIEASVDALGDNIYQPGVCEAAVEGRRGRRTPGHPLGPPRSRRAGVTRS